MEVELRLLFLHGIRLYVSGGQPRVKSEIAGVAHLLYAKLLDLIFRISLLHALAKKVKIVLA